MLPDEQPASRSAASVAAGSSPGHGAAVDIDLHLRPVLRRGPGRTCYAHQHRAGIALGGDPGRGVNTRQDHSLGVRARRQPGETGLATALATISGPVRGSAIDDRGAPSSSKV